MLLLVKFANRLKKKTFANLEGIKFGQNEALEISTLLNTIYMYPGCQRFSKRGTAKQREEKRTEGEKTSGCPWQLTVPIGLNSGQDLILPPDWRNLIAFSDWLLSTDRCVVIGCLLINSCDTYHCMIVRFGSPTTRGFLSPFLSLSCLVSLQQKKTSGIRVIYMGLFVQIINYKMYIM